MMFSLALVGCERPDAPPPPPNPPPPMENNDNTIKNVRDRDSRTLTPGNQSENENDLMITKHIRQAIISDEALSTNAKNIKIITNNRVVTLRGPVANAQEKDAIERKVQEIQGVGRVDNQLEVTNNNP